MAKGISGDKHEEIKKLIDALEQDAKSYKLHHIYTHTDGINLKAQHFYHKNGFIDEEYQFTLVV